MDKAEFIATLRIERAAWMALVSQVPLDDITLAGVVGNWSIQDLIAHVTWYENEMVDMIKSRTLDGSAWWELNVDERNQKIYEQNRHLSLRQVVDDSKDTYQQLLNGLKAMAEEEFQDARCFRNMPLEWIPWQVIASNCFEHYSQHTDDVKAWLQHSYEG